MASPRTKISDEQIASAAALVASGMNYSAAGSSIGVRGDQLRKLMVRRGHAARPGKRPSRRLTLPSAATDLAYIAGILDGEGSITKLSTREMAWRVCIYNTDLALMEWLQSFGGLAYVRPEHTSGFTTIRTQYGWHLNRRDDILALLGALLPYLRIKRQPALLAVGDLTEWFAENGRPAELAAAADLDRHEVWTPSSGLPLPDALRDSGADD